MKSYLLGLVIFIITIIINAILVKLQYIYFGEVALAVSTVIAGILYIKTIKSEIISKDILKASLVVYLGFIGLRMLPYLSYPQGSMPRAFFGALAGGLVSFIIVYVILYLFFAQKNKKIESIQVYSVTDYTFANQLTEMLSKNNIQAYSIENNLFDPLIVSTSQNNAISIRLKNNEQYKDALALIELFFKEQEAKESWICPKCNESIGGNFDACWNCGFEQ